VASCQSGELSWCRVERWRVVRWRVVRWRVERWRIVWASFRLWQVGLRFTANCRYLPSYPPGTANNALWWSPKKSNSITMRHFAVKRRPRVLGNSDTGHANVSCFQTLYLDMPQRKSKLESELLQNPPYLRTLILHLLMLYSMDRSFETANF
jgi:hypothetical protein